MTGAGTAPKYYRRDPRDFTQHELRSGRWGNPPREAICYCCDGRIPKFGQRVRITVGVPVVVCGDCFIIAAALAM